MSRIVRERHVVTSEFDGMRFQEYGATVLELLPSRAGVKKAIKRGELTVDGAPAETGRFMREDMVIELLEGELPTSKRFEVELPILYEDEFLAIINKPAGIPVSGNAFKTVQNGLAGNVSFSSEPDALPIPRPVHRLDALTSGLLVIAKTTKARIVLGDLFAERKVQKTYNALVMGATPEFGEIESIIDEKPAYSTYKRLKEIPSLKSGLLTLVELQPQTGRTHQLRIHCAEQGFPIVGDTLYGEEGNIILHKGLFLTAVKIELPHPICGETVSVEIELPKKFTRFMAGEEKRFKKYSHQ